MPPSSVSSAQRRSYHNLAVFFFDHNAICLHKNTAVGRLTPRGGSCHAVDIGDHVIRGGGGNAVSSDGLRVTGKIVGRTWEWVRKPSTCQGVLVRHRRPPPNGQRTVVPVVAVTEEPEGVTLTSMPDVAPEAMPPALAVADPDCCKRLGR